MKAYLMLFGFLVICFSSCPDDKPLNGKIICIDPGHGATAATDTFRIGPTGEREEWINLRVALILEQLLKDKGATILMTRTTDAAIPLKTRADMAVNNKADLFVSVHHNATLDSTVNFPTVYYHGAASENKASIQFAEIVARDLQHALFDSLTPVVIASDYVLFPGSGTSVLRNSYGIPGVITEASYFNNYNEEHRLKDTACNRIEATAIANAIEEYFAKPGLEIIPKFSTVNIPDPEDLKDVKRIEETARNWKTYFTEAKNLYYKNDTASIQKAYDIFTYVGQSYPDSYVAGECNFYRSLILKKIGKAAESQTEALRVKEFYFLPDLTDSLNFYKLLR